MRLSESKLRLSASDLANHLACRHLTHLDLRVARGDLGAPSYTDPALEALKERGFQHEHGYIEHLRSQGLSIVELPELGDAQAGLRLQAYTNRIAKLLGVDTGEVENALPDGREEWVYEGASDKSDPSYQGWAGYFRSPAEVQRFTSFLKDLLAGT